jgi:hypothetical protein
MKYAYDLNDLCILIGNNLQEKKTTITKHLLFIYLLDVHQTKLYANWNSIRFALIYIIESGINKHLFLISLFKSSIKKCYQCLRECVKNE